MLNIRHCDGLNPLPTKAVPTACFTCPALTFWLLVAISLGLMLLLLLPALRFLPLVMKVCAASHPFVSAALKALVCWIDPSRQTLFSADHGFLAHQLMWSFLAHLAVAMKSIHFHSFLQRQQNGYTMSSLEY